MLTTLDREVMFKVGLFELCVGITQQASGASDPWPDEDIELVRAYLRERLSQWHPNTGTISSDFDEAVRTLVEAALDQVSARELSMQQALKHIACPASDTFCGIKCGTEGIRAYDLCSLPADGKFYGWCRTCISALDE